MCFSHGLANPLVRLKPSGCSPPSCLLCATLLDDHSSKQKYGVYQETIVLHLTASRTPLPSSLTSEYFFLAYFFLKHENDEKQCLFSAQNNSFESFTDKNHCFWSNTSSLFPAHWWQPLCWMWRAQTLCFFFPPLSPLSYHSRRSKSLLGGDVLPECVAWGL